MSRCGHWRIEHGDLLGPSTSSSCGDGDVSRECVMGAGGDLSLATVSPSLLGVERKVFLVSRRPRIVIC